MCLGPGGPTLRTMIFLYLANSVSRRLGGSGRQVEAAIGECWAARRGLSGSGETTSGSDVIFLKLSPSRKANCFLSTPSRPQPALPLGCPQQGWPTGFLEISLVGLMD